MNRATNLLRRSWTLGAAFAALSIAPAFATVHTLKAIANGVEETPPNGSLGLAEATVVLDDVALTVTVTGSYSGLGSNATLCHIHGPSGLGTPSGILINLVVSGGTSGTISTGGSISAANAAQMLAGNTYLNVHTMLLPGGELRGQVLLEPTGSSLFCFGDGSIPTACPCVPPNPSAPGYGCANSFNVNGSVLKVHGSTAPDTVQFIVDVGTNYGAFGFLVKSSGSNPNGVQNADGIACIAGQLVRFGGHNAGTNGAPLGVWTYPNTVQTTPVSVATAQAPGATSAYQLFYRNAANFCTPATANFSSGALIPWP